MPSLGELSVRLVLDFRGIAGQLKQFRKVLQSGLNAISKEIAAGFKPFGVTAQQFEKAVKNITKAAAKSTAKAQIAIDKAAEKSKQATERMSRDVSTRIPSAFYTLYRRTDESIGQTLKTIFSFRNMVAKIAHYITFTVGVQLVMTLVRGFREMVDSTEEFQRAIVNAATISGYLGDAFDEVVQHLSKLALALSKETIFSATDVAKAFYQIASAGYDVSKLTKRELIPILQYAAATQTNLEDATYAVLTALKSFRLDISETGRVVDVFTAAITKSFQNFQRLKEGMKYVGATAGSLNLSLEETVAALSALVDRGLEGSQAGQRLNMILTRLLKPTDQAAETLQQLGLTADDVNPKYYSLVEILYKLKAAGFGAAEASAMFRARTAASAMVLVDSADSVARFSEMLRQSQGITESVAKYQEKTLWGALTKMTNAFQAATITLGEKLIPVFENLANFIKTRVVPAFDAFSILFSILKRLLPLFIGYKVTIFIMNKLFKSVTAAVLLKAAAFTQSAKATLQEAIAARIAAQMNNSYAISATNAAAAQRALNLALIANPIGLFLFALSSLVSYIALFNITTKKAKDPLGELNMEILNAAEFTEQWKNELRDFMKVAYGKAFGKDVPFMIKTLQDFGIVAKGTNALVKNLFVDMAKHPEQYSATYEKLAEKMGMSVDEVKNYVKYLSNIPEVIILPPLLTPLPNLRETMAPKLFKALAEIIKEFGVDIAVFVEEASGEIFGFQISLAEMKDALDEARLAQENLNRILKESPDDYDAIRNAAMRCVEAQEKLDSIENNFLVTLKNVIQTIRALPGPYDKMIQLLEDMASASYDAFTAKKELKQAIRDESEAVEELANAIAVYGVESSEARNAEYKLFGAMKTRVRVEEEYANAKREYTAAEREYQYMLKHGIKIKKEDGTVTIKLNETQKQLLSFAKDLIDLREQYIKLESEYTQYQAKEQGYQYLLEKGERALAEKAKLLYEARKKLYEIEYKLYKLRTGEDEQLDELFKKLAEEGLINEDLIDAYVDLMKSKSQLMALNPQLAKIYAKLNEEQRELIDNYINTGEGLDKLTFLTEDELDVVIAYRNAQEALNSSIASFKNILTPFIDSLEDIGAASADVIKAFLDLIDNAGEYTGYQLQMYSINEDLQNSINGVVGIVARLARALQDEADEADSVASIYDELLSRLELTDVFGDDAASILETLNELYETNYDSINEFTDAQLIAAAALVRIGRMTGIYASGMTLAQLATELQVESLNAFIDSAEDAYSESESMYNVLQKLSDVNSQLQDTFDAMTKTLNTLIELYYKSNESLVEWALQYDFADTMANAFHNDFKDFIKYMKSQDLSFSIELTTHWDDEDWDAFINSMTTDKKRQFLEAVSELSGTSVDVITKWDAEDWSTFLNTLTPQRLQALQTILETNNPELTIDTVLDTQSFIDKVTDMLKKAGFTKTPMGKWILELIIKRIHESLEGGGGAGGEEGGGGAAIPADYIRTYVVRPGGRSGIPLGRWGVAAISQQGKEQVIATTGSLKDAVNLMLKKLAELKEAGQIPWPWQFGGLAGSLFALPILQKIGKVTKPFIPKTRASAIVKSPVTALIGEAGPEAVIPLSGRNKRYGERLLKFIIPRYFPNLHFQYGGMVGERPTTNIEENKEEFVIHGPIIIQGVTNIDEFLNELKFKARATAV